MNSRDLSTVRELLRHGVNRFESAGLFFGHGSSNAWDEAAYLLLHALSLPPDELDPILDSTLPPDQVARVLQLFERRVTERVPAAYLTGEAWLAGYRFQVDPRVIVPRSFIAELIAEDFAPWVQDPGEVKQILELCTGSGCLAIMLADAFPAAQIDAVDLSSDALDVARRNVADYELSERIHLIESDLYEKLPRKKYDFIVTNPPYVNDASMGRLPQEYLSEPRIALAGGADGMDLVRRIVAGAGERLNENGFLMVEIGNEGAHADAAFGALEPIWLSTSAGDDMVFLLTAERLMQGK